MTLNASKSLKGVVPDSELRIAWRILRAEQMLKERRGIGGFGADWSDIQTKIDYRKPPARMELDDEKDTPPEGFHERATNVQLMSPTERVEFQMERIEEHLTILMRPKTTEEYGTMFLVAVAAGVALIFWEAVI